MKGLSSYAGCLMCLTLVISLTKGGLLQAENLVSSNAPFRVGEMKGVFVSPGGVEIEQGAVLPVFGSGEPSFRSSVPTEIRDQRQIALQLLTTLVIPTGRLYNWSPEPVPTPMPPSTSPSPLPPSPPTVVPPSGGPPDPTPNPNPKPLQSPEPSSLLLASLGIGFIGWSRRRSRKHDQSA